MRSGMVGFALKEDRMANVKLTGSVVAFFKDFGEVMMVQPELCSAGDLAVSVMEPRGNLDASLHADLIVDSIEADEPGKGWGTVAMRIVCDLADRHHVSLYLQAVATEGEDQIDEHGLGAFYAKFGFEDRGNFGHRDMFRSPKGPTPESEGRLADARRGEPSWRPGVAVKP